MISCVGKLKYARIERYSRYQIFMPVPLVFSTSIVTTQTLSQLRLCTHSDCHNYRQIELTQRTIRLQHRERTKLLEHRLKATATLTRESMTIRVMSYDTMIKFINNIMPISKMHELYQSQIESDKGFCQGGI